MDSDKVKQLSLFSWIITVFLFYPTLLGWLTWKWIEKTNAPMGLLLIGISAGLFLSTFHLLKKIKKSESKND